LLILGAAIVCGEGDAAADSALLDRWFGGFAEEMPRSQ
jgi:hypothetical protein